MALLTVDEFSERSRVDPDTARRWAREGRLPTVRYGRRWLIDDQALAPDQVLSDVGAVVPIDDLPRLLSAVGLESATAALLAAKVRELAAGGAR
jgi:excisionase family DNA binding protein